MKRIINSANAPAPIGPYNQAILVENTLYISGQIALDANTGEFEMSDIKTETKKVMDNLGAILNEVGADYSNIVIKVYNSLGQMKQLLVDQNLLPGIYKIDWDASSFESGLYLIRFESNNYFEIQKCLLLK